MDFHFIYLASNSLALLLRIGILQCFGNTQPLSFEILSLPIPSFLSSYTLIKFMLDLITVFLSSLYAAFWIILQIHFPVYLCFVLLRSVCCQIHLSSFSFWLLSFRFLEIVWFIFKSAMSLFLVFCSLRICSSLSFIYI